MLVLDFGLERAGLVSRPAVGHDEGVLPILVLEEKGNALLLHQAQHEIVGCLAILHAVIPLLVAALQPGLELTEPEIPKDLLHDVGHGLVLKDPAVGGPAEEPQPRYHLRLVAREAAFLRQLREPVHEPVEPAPRLVVRLAQRKGYVPAYDLVEINVAVLRQQVQLKMKRLRDRLRAGETEQQELVLPERCVDAQKPIFLRKKARHLSRSELRRSHIETSPWYPRPPRPASASAPPPYASGYHQRSLAAACR